MKRAIAACVCLVNAVALATYAAHAAGLTAALRTRTPGEAMDPFRYLQWLFTTPVLIVVLACVAGDGRAARRMLLRALGSVVLMVAAGFAERYAGAGAARGVLFAASGAAFCGTMRPLRDLFRLAAAAASAPEDAAGIAALWRHTAVVWSLFPATRLARLAGVLGPNAEETAFSALDVAAKMGYSALLLTGTFTLLDSLTQRRLARCDELMATIRGHQDGPSRLAGALAAAYREAAASGGDDQGGAGLQAGHSARRSASDVGGGSDADAAALVDAAVAEYVALAQGRSDAWGAPLPAPRARSRSPEALPQQQRSAG